MTDPIKATAKTLAAGKELPEAVKVETPKKKEGTPWPCEPEQLVQWKVEAEVVEKERKLFISQIESPLALEATAASGVAAAQKKMILTPRKASEPKEAKETKAEKKARAPKEGRQNRLGQTLLVDSLLKTKKTDLEIYEEVRRKIPLYPEEKIMKLVKLRKYHLDVDKKGTGKVK